MAVTLDLGAWRDQLAELVRDRPVILTATVAAATTGLVGSLRELGAGPILVVAGSAGAGPQPPPDAARVVSLGVTGASVLDAVRRVLRALDDPPAEVAATVEAFDPGRRALVLGELFTEAPTFLGRLYLAARRPEWVALEDKLVADPFWDRAGVARAPSAIVPLEPTSLLAALERWPSPDGVVVAADATEGWHGGAELVRRIRPGSADDDVARVIHSFAPARTVRAMPFVAGIPCSIHGIVLADAVVALRPVELLVLTTASGGFWYTGCATFFDPAPEDRAAMRTVARRVGERLRAEVDFRGAFTVDGVLGADGFVPTELNPRNGAGIRPLTQSVEVPIQLLLDVAVAGVPFDWRPLELETQLVAAADAHRAGATHREFPIRLEGDHGDLVYDRGDYRLAAVGEGADLRFEVTPSANGAFVRGFPVAERQPAGRPFGPRVAAFWRWADRTFGLGLEPMAAADDVRSAPAEVP